MSPTSAMPSPSAAGPGPHGSDPQGQAALLLVESLIHALIDAGQLSVKEAVGVAQIALDAQIALADVGRAPPAASERLEAILRSLEIDLRPA